ncbi:TetR/AcrR family transcriptional regulator [Octadecabacter antarcticus]|nr:TetR-like C-terminal domain-containing protein [Octadecabacter antarcticus]
MSKPYHHGELRNALIAAGTAALEETGNADISLRETARRAGVSPTATYRHFASKETLLATIAGNGFVDLGQRFAEAEDGLAGFGRAYIGFARDRPAMFQLMFGGAYSIGTLSEGEQKVGHNAYGVLIDAVAKHAELPPDDPKVLRRAVRVWSLVHGYAMLLLDDRLPDAAQSDAFLTEMLSQN